jgi:hypothetical protein
MDLIFIDTSFNSSKVVRVNVHQTFVLAAMKMHAYIQTSKYFGGTGLVFVSGKASLREKLQNQRGFGPFIISKRLR